MSDMTSSPPGGASDSRLYRAAWRWHFYAGLFVVPFLLILAVTGGIMMIFSGVGNELGYAPSVVQGPATLAVSEQARAALASVPDGVLATYIAPEAADRAAYFEINKDGAWIAAAVDPYTGKVLAVGDESQTLRAFAEKIHGTLLLGETGDHIMEMAASLAVVLIATGIYLWWPRKTGLIGQLIPKLSLRGRPLWRELHRTAGFWMVPVLLTFLLTGLAWSGLWGDTLVKPWSSFPANKWDSVPLSDTTHSELNHDILHNVPWGLELTPMPASGSTAGTPAVPQPVVLDTVASWALANGFSGQHKIAVPSAADGVYTVSNDGRNEDGGSPGNDRYVHIDRYTGNVLADVRIEDYQPLGKVMAWGIALHKGMAGAWNFVLNLVFLALIIGICVSGIVMWWKRRPAGAARLAAPPMPADMPMWKGAVLVGLTISLAFPMAGIALLVVLALDVLVLRFVRPLRAILD